MNPMRTNSDSDGMRAQLESEADHIRAHLASVLSALDRRRQEMLNLSLQAHRHRRQLSVVSGVASMVVLAAASGAIARAHARGQRKWQQRSDAALRFWFHPERLARRRSFIARALTGLLATAMAGAVGASVLTWTAVRRVRERMRAGSRASAAGSRPVLPPPPAMAVQVQPKP